jgi:hypothetical protein
VSITVTVLADAMATADLYFFINLSNPINGVLGSTPSGKGTIHIGS